MDSVAQPNRCKTAALILGVALPPILLGYAMLQWTVDFPYWDDWAYLWGAFTYLEPDFDWKFIFAKRGNHVNASTKLLFYTVWKLAAGKLTFCFLLNYVLAWMVGGGLLLLLRRTLPRDGCAWLFYPLAALFSFSLVQWPVFFSAWGSCWLLLPVFLRAGMLMTDTRLGLLGLTTALALFSAGAALTLTAGYALWVAFPFYLWLCGLLPKRPLSKAAWGCLALWCSGAALCLVVIFSASKDYGAMEFLERDKESVVLMLTWCLENPHRAIGFLLSLLGASSSSVTTIIPGLNNDSAAVAMAIGNGAVSMVMLVLTLRYALRERRDAALLKRLAPWLAIAVVELVMAGLVTLGRAGGFTMYRALSSHYGMIGLQFQFATYVAFYLIWREQRAGGQAIRFAVLPKSLFAGAMLMVAAQLLGQVQLYRDIRGNARQKRFARDAMHFVRILPSASWPPPLRTVRMHRLDKFAAVGVLDLATSEEIEDALANAKDETAESESKFEVSYVPHLLISGSFKNWLREDSPTLLVELRGADNRRVLLPARAAVGEYAWSYICEESLAIYSYPGYRVGKVYLFVRSTQKLVRVH
ncbi:MAG: hypothetical protein ACPGVU_19380 [Limisphaerales bacterium]